MPRVAEHVYYNPLKTLNPYYFQIGYKKGKGLYYRRVFPTLEEAVKCRDAWLSQPSNPSLTK